MLERVLPLHGYPSAAPGRPAWTDVLQVVAVMAGATAPVIYFAPVHDDLVKRLMWSGLLAALGAIASIAANRAAASVWRRVFDEDPPD